MLVIVIMSPLYPLDRSIILRVYLKSNIKTSLNNNTKSLCFQIFFFLPFSILFLLCIFFVILRFFSNSIVVMVMRLYFFPSLKPFSAFFKNKKKVIQFCSIARMRLRKVHTKKQETRRGKSFKTKVGRYNIRAIPTVIIIFTPQ